MKAAHINIAIDWRGCGKPMIDKSLSLERDALEETPLGLHPIYLDFSGILRIL